MPPLPVWLYSVAANLVAPLAYRRIAATLKAQGIDEKRISERMGKSNAPRSQGTVIWFHAASLGEGLSVLRLITHMGEINPDWSFVITTGTATSAQTLAKRLPPRTTHQFAPLDARRAVNHFLAHWNPSAAIFVESELWPQMISLTHRAGIPLALLNARISDTSARKWKRFARTARHLMGHFALIHSQDARTTGHLHDLGLTHAQTGQNLKSVSGPLPFDDAAKSHLQTTLGARPIWLACSTHPDEDDIALQAHKTLLVKHSDLMLILVPRHPERATAIEPLITAQGLTHKRRSTGGQIDAKTQVYLADTIGETGLWYALSPITCLCGSFTSVGGHNPYEPAFAGSAVIHGPQYANFTQAYADCDAIGGAAEVIDATTLAAKIDALLTDPDDLQAMQDHAHSFATTQTDMLDQLTETLSQALDLG